MSRGNTTAWRLRRRRRRRCIRDLTSTRVSMTAAGASALMAVTAAVLVTAMAAEMPSTENTTQEMATATVTASEASLSADSTTTTSVPVSTASAGTAPASQVLLLNKCCKQHEQLDQYQQTCIGFKNVTEGERDSLDQVQERWDALRGRGQPAWLTKKVWTHLRRASSEAVVRYGRRPCPFALTSVKWTNEAIFYSNGSMKVLLNLSYSHPSLQRIPTTYAEVKLWRSGNLEKKQYLLLSPEEYCVDRTALGNTAQTVILTCPCARTPCVRKCCDYKQQLTLGESVAMVQAAHCMLRENSSLNLTLHTDAWPPQPADVAYTLLRGPFRPSCALGRQTIALDSSDIETADILFLANGSLSAKVLGSPFLPQEYCVDRTVSPVGKARLWVLVCAQVAPPRPITALDKVYVALYVLGMATLVATLVVYALLPELRRPVNAKALMCHVAALAVALLVLCISRFVKQAHEYAYCASLALVAQFSLLAAFCWLSVLCFDIARAFSTSLRPVDSSTGAACRRLFFYSLFAWGGPAVSVSVAAYLNFAAGLSRQVLRPDIGRQGCWFKKGKTVLAYYDGPVAFLLLANVAMFFFMVMRLRLAQRETAQLKNEETQLSGGALRRRRERLLLYVKLFSLMGVTYLLEVVAWATGAGRLAVFAVDTINVLRGVGVFVACCCKREVLRSLRARLAGLLPCAPRAALRERGMSYTVTTTLSATATPDALRMRLQHAR